jgi:predicted CoA-substrate-specific enzyme activase
MYSTGIDIGSASGEVVILDDGRILSYSIVETGYNSRKAADLALEKALAGTGLTRGQLGPIVATGYGRVSIGFADRQVTEISCYAKGINFLFPQVRTVIDIGGQDSKVISLNARGKAVDFAMNDKCAAGTGRFLEVMARALQLELEQFGAVSLRSRKQVQISSMCTVFAESEVISLVAEGVEREDIVAGLHRAVARRIGTMVKRIGLVPPVAMAGGVAKNVGMVRALQEELGEQLIIPEEPQIVGALGAALIAQDDMV